MMRTSAMVAMGLLALSFPQQAVGSSTKDKQRDACSGMSSGEGCNYSSSDQTVSGSCGMDTDGDSCCNTRFYVCVYHHRDIYYGDRANIHGATINAHMLKPPRPPDTVFLPHVTLVLDRTPEDPIVCPTGSSLCGEPHMQGLRGQRINWSGVDGGWYCLVKDTDTAFHVNVRLTAPDREEFPDRQLVTGLSLISDGSSLVVEVKDPYTTVTSGCPDGHSVCLANGGLRAIANGEEATQLLIPTRDAFVNNGIGISASNLPVECREFGGDKLWARMYAEMLEGGRELTVETFEDWVLSFDQMAAPDWCAKYVAEHGLAEVQSIHAIFKIMTPTVDLRLNAGFDYQEAGEINWDGRVLPELEFWQMDVGFDGLYIDNPNLSGILGETARPVVDENGSDVMDGYDAFRGTVEDYRVSHALGTDFALLH